ncbi:hypothetical protein ACUOFU_11480 [Microbacterium arabinogalactanolyticum]|uniref:hypothetical protein n=1 Tax=Microbacterium arabinogalactanolyticum TaxID=69365 RepID=UPI004043E5DD
MTTRAEYAQTLLEIFSRDPDLPAIKLVEQTWTFGQLIERASMCSARLAGMEGVPVGIHCDASDWGAFPFLYLSALLGGAVPVIASGDSLADAGYPIVRLLSAKVKDSDFELVRRGPSQHPTDTLGDNVGHVVATSGSTALGKQQLNPVPAHALKNESLAHATVRRSRTVLNAYSYPFWAQYTIADLCSGKATAVSSATEPADVWREFESSAADIAVGSPSWLRKVCESRPGDGRERQSPIIFVTSSEPVSQSLRRTFYETFPPPARLYNYFGASEAWPAVLVKEIPRSGNFDPELLDSSSTTTVDLVVEYAAMTAGTSKHLGEIGRIVLRSPDREVETGDFGVREGPGTVRLLGRWKDAVETPEGPVTPEIVFRQVSDGSAVDYGYVIRERLIYFALAGNDASEVASVQNRLSHYSAVADVRIVDSIPRTPFGKVDRSALNSLWEVGEPKVAAWQLRRGFELGRNEASWLIRGVANDEVHPVSEAVVSLLAAGVLVTDASAALEFSKLSAAGVVEHVTRRKGSAQ